jgi:hypothetical protein
MARKPAVKLGLSFPVTGDAKFHLECQRNQAVKFFYITVANRTIYIFFNMGCVIEFNMVRNIIYPFPGNRGFCFQVPALRNQLRM